MKKIKTVVSLLLVFCMVFSLTTGVFATETEEIQKTAEETQQVLTEENPVETTENSVEETDITEESVDSAEVSETNEKMVYATSAAALSLENDEEGTAVTATATARSTSDDDFYKIVHLDAGRKYFSPENIKKIIDNAAAAGFNQVELYLSDNQGFRFALDDMNVTTSTGNTYDLTPALGDGYSDGSKYPDGSGKYLTQSEMTDIISYATGKGIDIVPCINVPGHMGAILEEFTQFKYSGSNSSIDLENAEAVAFALAITEKYAAYFESQGVKYYNLGADEYANDLSTMGFQGLYTSGKYQKFVDFLNSTAQIVINHGMTPRAFNDGIYYNEDNTYSINSAIQVCYWSCGWSGYNLASAQYLINQGMDVINTHGDYYWVLGNTSWQCSADKASQFDYTSFQYRTGTTGNGTISEPAGAMFCIWCDVGNANGTDGGTAVVSATADVIAAFGAALPASETGNEGDSGSESGGDSGNTGDVEVTENETITVTVGQTETATISNANYAGTYTTEDSSIATVEVTGKDAVEATTTYTQASVTCNTLISRNSDNWTAVSGYYYKADDGNYYPVYAKRSRSWSWSSFDYTYTYTWGYSTTSSASNVTQIGTQSTTNTGTTPNITVYTKSSTDGTPASTTVTFTGVAVGTTYVTVGNTRYTINVVAEDLSTVTPLTVEFWITNRQVEANGATSMTIAASASGVYSEAGIEFSKLVPATGTQDSNTMVFWKGTRLASDNKQTTGSGVDKTNSGTDFTYIRYWEGSWAYSADGKTWTNVTSGDQIVAYYLQKTEVTDEVTTEVVDWGVIPSTSYNSTNFVLVDFAVKYESGELTPSSFPVSGKTMAFHCDPSDTTTVHQYNYGSSTTWSNNYRDIGMIKAEETADYEVYMITVTPTSDSNTTQVAGNANTATSYTYGGTEKVVWVDDEANLGDFADESLHYTSISGDITYSVGGEPIVPGLEIFNRHGMLVTYYVRAKVTEASLAVHYIDQTANQEFYNYNIAVKSGTLFNENIGLADPWKGNLANGSVTNLQDKTQTVSADLSTMPAIGAQYRYSDYTCVEVVRSEDGKDVYLYYTFNNAHSFVVDFGLPLTITTEKLGISGSWTSADVAGAIYGTATATVGEGVTYTPLKTIKGVETLQLTLTDSTGSVTHQIYIYPATTVYYEEGFAELSGFTGGSKGSSTQTTQIAGKSSDNYGYDRAYESTGASAGTQATASGEATATFEFAGTGVELYTNNTTDTGNLMAKLYLVNPDGTEKLKKTLFVQTAQKNGDEENITTGQAMSAYNEPVVVLTGLDFGNYKLVVTNSKVDSTTGYKPINIDGFRVFDTLNDNAKGEGNYNSYYKADLEDNPTFIEMRDQVLASLSATLENSDNALYKKEIAGNIYSQIYATGAKNGAVVITNNQQYTNEQLQDLLDNGPKNEIYLQPGQALVFKVNTDRQVQLGMKVVNDQDATYTLNNEKKTLLSSTDMFYDIPTNEEITITNTSSNGAVIGITLLKICDDPNAAFAELTVEDLEEAVGYLYGEGIEEEAPSEPEVTYADATLNISLSDESGNALGSTALTASGVAGETATFAAADIEAAVEGLVPEGYELKDASYSDVEVVYGETGDVTFMASAKETDNEEETEPEENPEEKPEQPSNVLNQIIKNIRDFFKNLFGK